VVTELIPTLPGTPYGLGRHVNHDPASLRYPFAARPEAAAVLQSVEWTRRSPIFDQGQLGSCTGNAGEGWEATDNIVRQGSASKVEADAVDLYSAATREDDYPGSYPPEDTGSDGLTIAKVLMSRGVIDQYTHGFSVDDLKAAIQTTPVLQGTYWYNNMFDTDSRGVVSIADRDRVAGGHEYLLVGWDMDESLGYPAPFKYANSWGTGWGDGGHFYMTEATVARLLSEQGDATVLHAAGGLPPVPPQERAITKIAVTHLSRRHSTVHTVKQATVFYSDGTTETLP
jgi:hypothetical protein